MQYRHVSTPIISLDEMKYVKYKFYIFLIVLLLLLYRNCILFVGIRKYNILYFIVYWDEIIGSV